MDSANVSVKFQVRSFTRSEIIAGNSYKPVVRSAVDQYHQYNNDGCDTQNDDSDYDCDIDSDSSGCEKKTTKQRSFNRTLKSFLSTRSL